MSGRILFLSVSNARSGSTWLETSLGRLPDTTTDFEFKWRPKGYRPSPVHLVLPDDYPTCRDGLRRVSETAPITGSKMVLDPYAPFPAGDVPALLDAIDPDIRIVHLTRRYFDILLSLGVRGGRNLLNDVDAMAALTAEHGGESAILNEIIKQTKNDIASGGRESPQVLNYDVNLIVNKFVILLLNDLICAAICRRAERSLRVDYSEISARFAEIARFVGSAASEQQATDIIRQPVTRKLKKVPPGMMANHEKAQALSGYFESVRDELIDKAAPLEEVWQGSDIVLPRSRDLSNILR